MFYTHSAVTLFIEIVCSNNENNVFMISSHLFDSFFQTDYGTFEGIGIYWLNQDVQSDSPHAMNTTDIDSYSKWIQNVVFHIWFLSIIDILFVAWEIQADRKKKREKLRHRHISYEWSTYLGKNAINKEGLSWPVCIALDCTPTDRAFMARIVGEPVVEACFIHVSIVWDSPWPGWGKIVAKAI